MKLLFTNRFQCFLLTIFCSLSFSCLYAQTDMDAIMMTKNNFCTGIMYSNSSWKNYWEGTFKRDNKNLGTVSTQMLSVMGNYGISDKLNFLFSVPYIETKATAGTLHGMKGVQDLSLVLKWMPIEKELGKGTFSLYGIGAFSFPVTNYIADFMPLSIGMHSKTLTARLMADYQLSNFFVTASGSYTYRSNINIDRTSYYTTNIHLTNEVEMPDMVYINFRTGYRSGRLIAEAVVTNMTTLKGFDIRKNDMPFPSNKMNALTGGVNFKYNIAAVPGLSLIANGGYVLAGRNVGQSTTLGGGAFYIIDFSKKTKKTTSTPKAL